MVLRTHSLSSMYATFEVELEGAILQHTAAVDHYLETAAAKWTVGAVEHATPRALREVFLSDLNSSLWRGFAHSGVQGEIGPYEAIPILDATAHKQEQVNPAQLTRPKRRPRTQPLQTGHDSRLQQYLQQQAQHVQPQMDSRALQLQPAEAPADYHGAHLSSCNCLADPMRGCSKLLAAAQPVVRLPASTATAGGVAGVSMGDAAQVATDALPGPSQGPAAAAVTPAEPLGAAQDTRSAHIGSVDVDSPAAAALGKSATGRAASLAASPGASIWEAGAAASYGLESDDDLMAQKLAARARLAELEGTAVPAGCSTAAAEASNTAAAPSAAKILDDAAYEPAAACIGSVHSSAVPQRPRALAGKLQTASRPHNYAYTPYAKGDTGVAGGGGAVMQQCRFTQALTAGLLLCMVLLGASLWGQAWSSSSTLLQHPLLVALQQYGSYLYAPTAAAALLYTLSIAWTPKAPLLYFTDPVLEAQYLEWSNTGKLFVDCMFQVLFLVVGSCLWLRLKHTGVSGIHQAAMHATTLLAVVSMLGSGLPVMLLLVLRSERYMQWREQLIAGSKLCSVAVLALTQLSLPTDASLQLPYGTPFVALAQLVGVACMQVRLATFVPCQVAHLLVLLFKTRAANPLLHFAQLFGGGLCLPGLLLRSMEIYSRKAFLAAVVSTPGSKQKQL